MRRSRLHRGTGHVAAFLAVLLLALAGVRSALMQVEMASAPASMPNCRMAMGGHADHQKPASENKGCVFCAAAAHAPLCSSAPDLTSPTVVAWVLSRPVSHLGARWPPAIVAKARGPPLSVLTV